MAASRGSIISFSFQLFCLKKKKKIVFEYELNETNDIDIIPNHNLSKNVSLENVCSVVYYIMMKQTTLQY
jgi:hypothetical protein